MGETQPLIAVVIPFYQRGSGILDRALRSVLAQTGVDDVHVLIVDDESPIPAESEVATLGELRWPPIRVIHRAHAGPGAARNRGLDSVPIGTRYVAFLDSDDVWSDDHLINAVTALRVGYDFYFSDFYRIGWTESTFTSLGQIVPALHPALPGSRILHRYCGDLFGPIVTGQIKASTVVYDFCRFASLRFREEFTHAGEDTLMWMELARLSARPAFSAQCEVRCGSGVNIHAASSPGTDGHAWRLIDRLRSRRVILASCALTEAQQGLMREQIHKARVALMRDVLQRLVRRKTLSIQIVRALLRHDPVSFLAVGPAIAAALRHRMIRR